MHLSIALNTATAPAPLLVDAARAADAAGFSAVYCYDHLSGAVLGGQSTQHLWSLLGAVAAATRRTLVGPLVANVTTRPAVDIALAAATLQQLSQGRAVLGLGAGASGPSPYAAEMAMFGLPAEPSPRRRARVAETVSFLRALWRGDAAFRGEWASFSDVQSVPVPVPPCPIVVGANGPKMSALAGEHADAVNLHSFEPRLAELVDVACDAARRVGNRAFRVTVEVPFGEDWLDAGSEGRERLAAMGVAETILAWRGDHGVAAIERLVLGGGDGR